ncbi:glycosyltransferase family 17 protein, partial [Sphaerobolus stellatus SS14]
MPPLLARRSLLLIAAVFILYTLFYLYSNQYQIRNTISYATRPLWDTSEAPQSVITHYHAEGLKIASEQTCSLHDWALRKSNPKTVKVLDAVLVSSEMDLLEIRMHELDAVVDYFLIVENNATFTGLKKERYFANNRERFGDFAD